MSRLPYDTARCAVTKLWCAWTHGGGTICRDSEGRINWRCDKCGRWSDHPVPTADEVAAVNRDILEYWKRRGRK